MMNERVKRYLDELFEDAPKTRKAMELKEEMMQNSMEKYQDLLGDGYSEEDAYKNVIGSIGDVTELFEDLEEKNLLNLSEADRKKKAILTSVAVGLYILAGVVLLASTLIGDVLGGPRSLDYDTLGLVLAAAVCIAPTCMLVYAANMYPDYRKKKENLVEDYKEAKHASNRDKAVRTSISTIIWTMVVILYFIFSFSSGAWHISWVIFLMGGCVEAVCSLIYSLRQKN
ncbi:MAG: permease prefix domain 1-containing protein [Lachnospiraceae bacterium]|nr:permease prefix domain 1-containing protein [Lachnospiraceae bacterium]